MEQKANTAVPIAPRLYIGRSPITRDIDHIDGVSYETIIPQGQLESNEKLEQNLIYFTNEDTFVPIKAYSMEEGIPSSTFKSTWSFKTPETKNYYQVEVVDVTENPSANYVPRTDTIYIVSGDATIEMFPEKYEGIKLTGNIGRLLHPIATPVPSRTFDTALFNTAQTFVKWADLATLGQATQFYCQEQLITEVQKYDVAQIADGTVVIFDGQYWTTDKLPGNWGEKHEYSDNTRWQNTLQSMTNLEARLMSKMQTMLQTLSQTPVPVGLDYDNPVTVVGTNGIIAVGSNSTFTVPSDGAIVCSAGGILSTAVSVIKNNDPQNPITLWSSPVYLLGLQVGGDENPSEEISVVAGDVIAVTGLLSVGSPVNVTFYADKTV